VRTRSERASTTKEKPGFWTRRRAFEQVRHGSNIQLLSFSLVTDSRLPLLAGYRTNEERIASTEWNKIALLAYIFSKWEDADAQYSQEAEILLPAREERFADVLERYGAPPPHFNTIAQHGPQYWLPSPKRHGQLYDLLTSRKTARVFDTSMPVSGTKLGVILRYVWGCHGYAALYGDVAGIKRTSPSGGGLHPIEVYPLVVNVEGLPSGLYHYNVENHRLDTISKLSEEEARSRIRLYTAGQSYFQTAAVVFIMTARFYRNFWKYRQHPKAYSVVLMDAAHLSQSFYLVCTELGLGPFVTAAVNNRNIDEHLGCDGITEGTLVICGCGVVDKTAVQFGLPYREYVLSDTRERRGFAEHSEGSGLAKE
jgi:putative peptide maturation dehydrogenase